MSKYNVASYNLIYIYAIHDDNHKGLLKIGKASFNSSYSIAQLTPNCPTLNQAAHLRIGQQTKTAIIKYELLHAELATRTITMQDGSTQIQSFEDYDVHDVLLNSNFSAKKFVESGKPSEWYEVDLATAKAAITAVKQGRSSLIPANIPSAVKQAQSKITLRREQEENVEYTIDILKRYDTMLWNCKMRYGKTVTAYELIKRQKYQKVIVITHRPAVEDSWGSDHELMFAGTNHLFIDKTNGYYTYDGALDAENDHKLKQIVKSGVPFVYFASIQDLRGSKRVGGKFNKNNGVFDLDWDLLIVDEAHEGTATSLGDAVIKTIRKPNTKVLLLSGTPYNMMSEFEENKYTWTYVDEQRAKQKWDEEHPGEKNPYEELPQMNMFTFDLSEQMPTSYRYVTEDSAFNFREFFRTWTGDIVKDFYKIPDGKSVGDFVHEDDVFKFLTLISKEDANSNYPFSCEEYRDMFAHTFWIVPGVKEAKALSALIQKHPNFKDKYEVVNIAGDGDEEKPYDEALPLVRSSIKSFDRTITISCGKLTTGVTVREWTAVMMLSGSSSTSASGYMQAIFRVQSPGYINGKQKQNCYVFDFAPDRTLKVIAEVHQVTHKGSKDDNAAKQALGEFINFCPIISVEGTEMRTYDVAEMMRQIKRISVDSAINSGFDDDTIYLSDAGMSLSALDVNLLRKLSDVVVPQKKGKKQTSITITDLGMTDEQRKLAKKVEHKPKKDLTPEEKAALELYKKQKEEQKKMFNLLRAVSIRLPLLFYGVDADITKVIQLKDFVKLVDDESWQEFMPRDLKKDLFLDILRYYDQDVVVGAGLRIRKMAKAADELPPTLRAQRIVEILSKFKNPDKETVLTPWRVVNMHMGDILGGYNFFDEHYHAQLDEPRFLDKGDVSTDVFLNSDAKILEMNSKSGLYPLYLAYTFYMLNVTGKEKDLSLEQTQKIWFDILDKHIFVLCKTKMARAITIRTLAGYSNKTVHAIYLTKLIEERMKDIDRLAKKLTNPDTWGIKGERMKFDAVVGNPPYQELVANNIGSVSQANPVYHYFIETAMKTTSKYFSLITPSLWMTAGTGLESFRQMIFAENKISKFFDYETNDGIFNNVAIAGGVSYFLWDKNYSGKTAYTYQRGDLSVAKQDIELVLTNGVFIRDPMAREVLLKVGALEPDFDSFMTIVSTYSPFANGVVGNYKAYFLEQPKDNTIKIYRFARDRSKFAYIERSKIIAKTEWIDMHKVYVSKAGEVSAKFNGLPFYGEPGSACNETYLVVGPFADKITCERVIKYMNTHLYKFLIAQIKKTQNAARNVYKFVPMQNFDNDSDIDWDKNVSEINALLYKKYNLSKEEILFIESATCPIDGGSE